MKKISIMVPCYNEEENVEPLSEAIIAMFAKNLPQYDYEILFIDNDSTDTTRVRLRRLCENNPKIKAIFNAKNFGQFNWNITDNRRLYYSSVCRFSGSY